MQTKALMHRQGGRITAITAIGHELDRYYFIADVAWDDGGQSDQLRVEPYQLVIDEAATKVGEAEYVDASDKLADYLRLNGEWQTGNGRRHWVGYYARNRWDFDAPRWVKVPTRFLADHIERGLQTPNVKAYCPLKSHNYIDANDAAIEDLLADARHYASPGGPDQLPRGLKQSAKALIRHLRKANVTSYTLEPGDTE